MKKLFISILTVIGIIVIGFTGEHTFSKFYNNYAYAGEFDSQNGKITADTQTDNGNSGERSYNILDGCVPCNSVQVIPT